MTRGMCLTGLLCLIAAATSGCNRAATHRASLAVFAPQAPSLSLGAGDSLGRSVYFNDLVLAARNLPTDDMVTAATDQNPIDLAP